MAGKTVAGELYESITGQLFEIGRQLRQSTGYPFDPDQLKGFLQRAVEGKFEDEREKASVVTTGAEPAIVPESLRLWHAGWPAFLAKHKLPEMELPKIDPAKYRPGFDWSVVDPQGLTINQAFELCRNIFNGKVWKWQDDLDSFKIITNQARAVEAARAILVRSGVESDKEWRKKNTLQIEERGTLCLTPRKYLLLAARLKDEKDIILDCKGWTLFSGFRNSGGIVPCGCWDGSKLGIGRTCLDDADGFSGVREAVTL